MICGLSFQDFSCRLFLNYIFIWIKMNTNKLDNFKIQLDFFSFRPVKTIIWKDYLKEISYGDSEWQNNIYNNTVGLELLNSYPIKASYQLSYIKQLISELEHENIEVICQFYEKLSELFLLNNETHHYVHYLINNQKLYERIIMKENIHYISQGTTGLCSWEASKALSQWAITNKGKFHNKVVLELGSGIGLTGIIITLLCDPKKYIFSDCHPNVLEMLHTNIMLNMDLHHKKYKSKMLEQKELLNIRIDNKDLFEEETSLAISDLPWEEIDNKISNLISPDIVIAADIIYDTSLFPILINAIKNLIKTPKCECIIAITQRNEDTLNQFLELLRENKIEYDEIESPTQNIFNFSTISIIKFFQIKH